MSKKKSILFILPSLEGGGSQRVILTIIKYLDREKFLPKLALIKKEGEFLSQIPHDIKPIDLNAKQLRYAIFKIIKLIKSTNPDIVFSTLGHLNLMIALLKPVLPKNTLYIARESNTLSIQNRSEKYPKIFDWLFKHIYKNFDLIITQSQYMKNDLITNYNIDNKKISVIYNPLDIDNIKKLTNSQAETNKIFNRKYTNLLAIGRVDHQKGYDLLLKSLINLNEKFLLTILGDGQMKEELKVFTEQNNLAQRVIFKGFIQNPYSYIRQADLLILSSRYEGFANVVLEANFCGLPVVAFEAPGVNEEIIKEGFNGFLVKNFDTKKFARVIEKASKHNFDQRAIKEYTKRRFNAAKIVKEYEYTILNSYKKKSL